MTTIKINASIVDHALIGMDSISEGTYFCDLHNELFNMDYFLIGYYNCEQWLINNVGIFNAIEAIKQYEQDNFGEVNTDFSSSEKVCNMYAYILGEKLLNSINIISDNWNSRIDADQIDEIKYILQEML